MTVAALAIAPDPEQDGPATPRAGFRDAYKRGWSVVALRPNDKKALPPWKALQEQRAGASVIKDWLTQWPDANPGIVTGRVSGLFVIDVDSAEGLRQLYHHGDMPLTASVATAKGTHYYFRYPALREGQRVITKARIFDGVDVRGDGGYVVAPGAVHETGVIYEWQRSPDTCPLAECPDWLLSVVVADAAQDGPTQPIQERTYTPMPAAENDRDREYDRHRKYALAALEGERRKLEAAPDGTKHDRLLRSADAVSGFVPYLTEWEIEQALYEAIADRAGDRALARKTIRDGIRWGTARPREIPDAQSHAQSHAYADTDYAPEQPSPEQPAQAPEQPQERAADPWAYKFLSQLEGTTESVPWRHHGYIADGMITLLTGLWKSGKTTYISHLLRALGTDSEFVGHAVRQTKCLVVAEEVEYHWRSRRDALGIGDNVAVICKPFMVNAEKKQWEAFITRLAEYITLDGFELIVFDSIFNLWWVKDENDSAQVREAIMPLNMLTKRGAAVLLLGHPKKGDAKEGQATRGSGSLPGAVDIITELRRYDPDNVADNRRVLTSYSRFDETPQELTVNYDAAWGYAGEGTRADVKAGERKRAITAMLPTDGLGYSLDDILREWPEEVERPGRQALGSDLDAMMRDGQARQRGTGSKADPFRYWASDWGQAA